MDLFNKIKKLQLPQIRAKAGKILKEKEAETKEVEDEDKGEGEENSQEPMVKAKASNAKPKNTQPKIKGPSPLSKFADDLGKSEGIIDTFMDTKIKVIGILIVVLLGFWIQIFPLLSVFRFMNIPVTQKFLYYVESTVSIGIWLIILILVEKGCKFLFKHFVYDKNNNS